MGDSPQGEVETKKEKTKKGNFIYRDTMALIGWETCCLLFWQTTVIQRNWLQSVFVNALHSSSSFPLSLLYISA